MLLVHWLLLIALIGFVLAVYVPDRSIAPGARHIIPGSWVRPLARVGSYSMVLSIAALGLLALTLTSWSASLLPLGTVPLHGRQLAGAAVINAVTAVGPTTTGVVLIALAYWLYRHFCLER